MLDGLMRRVVDAPLGRLGRWLAERGVTADQMTLLGLCLGAVAALLLAFGFSGALVLAPLMANRLADGLDGAIARVTGKTDFGGYLDICADFAFYAAIPLAFVLRDPAGNGGAGAFLLFSFDVNGATFLGYAILAEKRGLQTVQRGEKSLYFTAGLMEGTETILAFVLMVLWPDWFVPVAWTFGGLCLVTAISRLWLARRVFSAELR